MEKIIEQFTDAGKLIWLALMVVGFIWFWPVGLAVLVYLVMTGRLGQRVNLAIGPWGSGFWSSGNSAFDEHREEILKKLRSEEKSFRDFIDELAKAKDKAEFNQFMSSRAKKRA